METDQAFKEAVASQLRAEQSARRMSQDELAEKAGVPKVSLQRYFSGLRDIPISRLHDITEALDLPTSTLIARAEERA